MKIKLKAERDGQQIASWDVDAGVSLVVGREAALRVDGERFLSRRHVEVCLEGGKLQVKKLPEASNPVYCAGIEKSEFVLSPGESFVIGATSFRLVAESEKVAVVGDQAPAVEHVMEQGEVFAVSDRLRLRDLLELPEILRTKERGDFQHHIASMLRMATGGAWAAVVTLDGKILGRDTAQDDVAVKLSRTLLQRAK